MCNYLCQSVQIKINISRNNENVKLNFNLFVKKFTSETLETNKIDTLVIATHGIIKKSDKPEKSEILKAKAIKDRYFESKK
jgi:CHAT domain-containing protein